MKRSGSSGARRAPVKTSKRKVWTLLGAIGQRRYSSFSASAKVGKASLTHFCKRTAGPRTFRAVVRRKPTTFITTVRSPGSLRATISPTLKSGSWVGQDFGNGRDEGGGACSCALTFFN